MRTFIYACTAATLAALSLFATVEAAPNQAANSSKSSEKFATNLFKLAAKKLDSNVVVSPFSVSSALTMTYNGAAGKTKSEMQSVLGYDGLSDGEINKQSSNLNKSLLKVNPVSELNIANGLFGNRSVIFNSKFIDTNNKFFGAKLESLDFSSPVAINRINGYVKENTKGKIPSILDKVPADAILYLVNAIYFKGVWLDEFKKSDTKPADFTLANNSKKSVPMMHRVAMLEHMKGDGFEAVVLPYKDNRLQMTIFLPDRKSNISALVSKLNAKNWQEWKSKFNYAEGDLALPRFKVEYKSELSTILKEAGMPTAFDPKVAGFKNMIDQGAYISRVLHKTYLEVNEKGTEAAAATAVEAMPGCAMVPAPPFKMVCDRPFIISIDDRETGAILFIGAIVDPTKTN